MSAFPVIFVAALISVVVADPNLYNQGQLNQFQIQPNFNPPDNRIPIDWNQYANGAPNNGLISYPNNPQDEWNKNPNSNNNNNNNNGPPAYEWNNHPNEVNHGFNPYPPNNQPPNQWNNNPNHGNNGFNSYPNQYPNEWNNHHHGSGRDHDKYTDCGPSIAWKDVPGMQWWCRANCFHIPSFCPSSHCRCWTFGKWAVNHIRLGMAARRRTNEKNR